MNKETVTLYRPLGQKELELVKASGYQKWPPRLPGQPFFYPVTNERYAQEITIQWNARECGVGYVARFQVYKKFMDQFDVKKVGAAHHTEWWIPAEMVEDLNKNIEGLIVILGPFKKNDTA